MAELIAYLGQRRVGRLIRKDNGNLQFRYDDAYTGPPLSHALPVQPEAHPHAVCHAVFGGLLLEGDARATLARTLGVSTANDFGLLAEVGGDCAGAITLVPDGSPPKETPTVRRLSALQLDELLRELPQRPLAADPAEGIRLSLAGAQPKLPVIIADDGAMALPTNAAAPTTHILKPEPSAFPRLVDNEAFCMALARSCGLSAAETRAARSVSGIAHLVVERFDRDRSATTIERLHQEDMCQALGVPSERKYQAEGGPSARDAAALLREVSATPARDLPRFVAALAFNWLIGNCDAHGKNYSVLDAGAGPRLAPLYDLVSTLEYPALTTRLAMSIGGATRHEEVDAGAWVALADRLGVRASLVRGVLEELRQRAPRAAAELIAHAEHDNETARSIAARVTALARGGR